MSKVPGHVLTMECGQCGKPALFVIASTTDDNLKVALCVDCNLKYEHARILEFFRLASEYNRASAGLHRSLGVGGFQYQLPRITVPSGSTVAMTNIHIQGDLLGVLNTGTIQKVDNSVTVIRNEGNEELATKLAEFVEAVDQATDLSKEAKQQVVELLSVVSTEVATPEKERRAAGMLAILANIATLVGTGTTIATQWEALQAMLSGIFS